MTAGRRAIAACLLAAASVSLSPVASGQPVNIPDLRQPRSEPRVLKFGEPCIDCGRVVSVREIQSDRKMPTVPAQLTNRPGSSSGLLDRTPVGAVVFLPLGGDPSERPFVGGVGTPEMRERFRETTFEVAVRMDDNSMRVIQRFDGSQYRAGDRVRITGQDQLELVLDR